MGSGNEGMTEQATTKTTVHSISPSPANEEEEGIHQRPDRNVRNAIYTIVTGVALPCIPILVILALLLYFIFHHRVQPWTGFPTLQLETTQTKRHGFNALLSYIRHDGGDIAYLVKYNPSTLTTIASWTSRIIPYLTSSIMALVAFFAARYIVQQSKKGDNAVLPDPEQLTILISLLGGSGVSPLKDTLFYRWLKKERLVSPVPAVFWVLAFITFLGLIIPAIDTWFGIATHPTTISILSNTTTPQVYGRQLDTSGQISSFCAQGPALDVSQVWITNSSVYWPCNVYAASGVSNRVFLANSSESIKLQFGLPASTVLSEYTHASKNWIFYTDPRSNAKLDFEASTFGMSTQCRPMTKKCFRTGSGPFQCSPGFKGDWSKPWPYAMTNHTVDENSGDLSRTGIAFAPDAELSSTPGLVTTERGQTWPEIRPSNPALFGTWAINYPSVGAVSYSPLYYDPDIITSGAGVLWWLNCSTTVAHVTYTWVNGSIHSFKPELASPDMAALFTGQFSLLGVSSDLLNLMKSTMANMATLASLADSMTQLAHTWANEFSKNAMALSVGVFVRQENTLEQAREAGVIVARIPLAPFYLLIGVKLIYVVAVIVLAIGAYAFTHPAETEIVKAQLSTKGLAAAHFDNPDLLQKRAVTQVHERLKMVHCAKTDEPSSTADDTEREPRPGEVKRSTTSPTELEGGKPKVGLVPDANGVYQFVVMANGVWHSISPIVKSFVSQEARKGELGAVGGVINAWK